MPASHVPPTSLDPETRCPACDSAALVVGTLEHRPARFFIPTRLRLWTLGAVAAPVVRGPRLPGLAGTFDARGLQACTACGLAWTRVDAARLREVIERAGRPELRAVLAPAPDGRQR